MRAGLSAPGTEANTQPMGQINIDIGERSELQSIDREAMARLAIQALSGPLVRTEDGVARVPARRKVRKDA